jgi:hypothetical protein
VSTGAFVASNGEMISATTLPGANKPNPECANFKPFDNNMEDPMSVASYITFGRFRTAHLGDLTRNMEFKLMCPNTRLPPLQLLLSLHHGVESSNSEVMVHGWPRASPSSTTARAKAAIRTA